MGVCMYSMLTQHRITTGMAYVFTNFLPHLRTHNVIFFRVHGTVVIKLIKYALL